MLNKITRHWPVFLLTVLTLILGFLNYQPGTFLIGWDNLQTELNPLLNLSRALSSVWQEYQSLGLPSGMAHAADLPRQLLLLPLSLLNIPISLHRYLYTFLCLILGPLGAYFLAKNTIFDHIGPATKRLLAFFAGLFYLLNLATVQNFYTPYEAFSTLYASLPWILLTTINYLKKPSKSSFLLLTLTFTLSSPSFVVQTNFLVLSILLLPILLHHFFTSKLPLSSLKSSFVVVITLLITQAYWLIPAFYLTPKISQTTINSLQNQVATPEITSRNQEYGNLGSVSLLKGFWFDYVDLGDNQQFQLMMYPWISHLNYPLIPIIGYLLFFLCLAGIVTAFYKRLPYYLSFFFSLLICFFFLINLNPPTGSVFSILQKIPLLGQVFRSVFTKWSIPTSLYLSLFFAAATFHLYNLLLKLNAKLTPLLLTTILIIPLIIYSAPAFQGNLIYKNVRQELPQDYLDLFSFMKDQDPATRLANFPQNTFWGWQFYTWGYRGSGFLWYGLPQSTLDRAFDVWSPQSEAYYQDIKQAIYSQNPSAFQNTLEKYSITWLLTDHYVTLPGTADQTPLYMVPLLRLIQSNQNITKVKDFGPLTLYRYSPQSQPNAYLDTKPKVFTLIPPTPPSSISTNDDVASIIENRSSLKSKAKNCDNFNSKYFDKVVDNNAITYSAIDANTCDHLLYPFLPQGTSYDLKITHKNLSGSPLQLCLESYVSKTCTLFLYLPTSPDWTTTTLKVPVGNPSDYGYTLHLFNYSIGQTVASNQLKQIEFIPTQDSITIPDLPSHNVATIQDVNKLGTFLYSLTATAANQNDLLVLNQAYDQDWLLYQDPSPTSPLWQRYLLSLFKRPLNASTHSLTYGWANSWQIPQGQASYLLVYWPQILQFIGFTLLLLLPLLIFLQKPRN